MRRDITLKMYALKFLTGVCLLALGANALVTEHKYHEKIIMEEDDIEDTFSGLDVVGNDKKVCAEDLNQHYYYKEADCAKKRFIDWIDCDKNGHVTKEELAKFVKKTSVTLAIHECDHIHSESLREYCFADQTLTYAMLVLDKPSVDAFFKAIENQQDKDEDITMEELDNFLKSSNVNSKVTYCEGDVKNMMIELGGDDGKISPEEFEEYVTLEDLHDDFRICRTNLDKSSCATTYDHACLGAELLDWTMNHFTERDCQATFAAFDKDKDGDIEENEVKNGCPDCSAEEVKKFIHAMDRSKDKDGKIVYSEFRVYAKEHWVKINLEKECAAKLKTQEEEIPCFVKELNVLIKTHYKRIWLRGSDLDMTMEFEALDGNDNGRIEIEADLKQARHWEAKAAANFIEEMDGADVDTDVSLEEFNEATDEPNLVYTMTDCMDYILTNKPKRIECYEKELQELMTNVLDDKTVKAFFEHYDEGKNGIITMDEIIKKGVKDEDSVNFMQEMGMGDETVNLREFTWYVKQERITEMFVAKSCGTTIASLHTVLMDYHETVFTEYDTQELFDDLDTDHDWELTSKDCGGHDPAKHQSLITRVDREDDHDTTVNFNEFWLYLNTPLGNSPRKLQLETQCTIPNEKQDDEMACYKEKIWDVQ